MGVPISNVTRRVVYTASGTGPYNFTFEILAAGDVAVYRDDTLLTITTDYTVTINANGTGFITLVASPTGATQIAIVGNRTIQRTTDFVTGGDFFANTVNDEMDQQTIFAQQNAEGLQRALQAPQTDPTTIDMTLPRAAIRASKVLSFDANGNPSATEFIGSNRGNWASGTLYYVRDIIKDTSTSNIWQCVVEHTSTGAQPIGTNADAAKWFLLVDAAAAGASATAAAASASAAATSASNASTSATNAASSASTASTQASNASTSATNAANSATAAASSASTASTAATNAGNSATAAATSATNASNSASSASTSASNASTSATSAANSATTATTQATNASNSASAASTSASNASTSATNAANSATASASSATAAAASAAAAAASFDAFDDIYLGAKSSDPTVDNDGNALTVGDQYFNTSANELRVYNGSTWQAASTVGGTVTSLSVTGATTLGQNPTLSAGTANGVAYLNGSKVLTTGSALTFDGVAFSTTGTINAGTAAKAYRIANWTLAGYSGNTLQFGNATTGGEWTDMSWSLSGSEQMRLTSTGLGIGTSSPDFKMVVAGNADTRIRVDGSSSAGIYFTQGGSNAGTIRGTTSGLELYVPSTGLAATLNSSGNLGLGVTPSAWGGYTAFEFTAGGAIWGASNSNFNVFSTNTFYNGSNWIYKTTNPASYYNQSGGAHAWHVAASGTAGNAISFTQAMTLDASGQLGIGTTSPTSRLQIIGSNSSDANNTLTGSWVNIGTSLTAGFGMRQKGNSTGISGITYPFQMATIGNLPLEIYTADAQPLVFGTSATERARIDSNGNLLVGSTTSLVGARVEASSSSIAHCFYRANATGGNTLAMWLSNAYGTAATAAYFRVDGGLANYSAFNANLSDERVKFDIKDAGSYLAKICAIPVRTFKYKNIENAEDNLGVIAQEVEAVAPELVDSSGWGETPEDGIPLKAIYQTDLQYALMKALQELKAEFDAYKATHP